MLGRLVLVGVVSLGTGVAMAQEARTINIAKDVPFSSDAFVTQNVRRDCDLPLHQAADMQEQLAARGWNVAVREGAVESGDGLFLKLEISGVSSSRAVDAVSHHQGVMVNARLFRGSTVIGDLAASRTSKGGVFGLFKSSCEVLYACTKANAVDIAKWLDSPAVAANLGREK